jgi:cell wall-associated NlpC family hydrolase
MIRVQCRGTKQSVPLTVLALFVASTVLTPSVATAQSITQTQAEIAALSGRLARLSHTSEITANAYDTAKVQLATLNASVINLQGKEAAKRAAVVVTSKKLITAAVRAYVDGASTAQILALFNQSASVGDARKVYEDRVIGNLDKLKNNYETQRKSLQTTIAAVANERAKASHQTYEMSALLGQNLYNINTTRATLSSLTTSLRTEIIAYEIQAGVTAAKKGDVSGEQQAVAAAAQVGGITAANAVTQAIQAAIARPAIAQVGSSAQGQAALHYAQSQLGVPYVWGGESPGRGFDCSGLVQWAWGRAGITIPRTTQTEWPAMVHVPLSALQPGDLLFYYNLDSDHQVDHVVMYVGSGPYGANTIIAAPYTGTNVSYAPIFTAGLIGAARP